MSLKKEIRRLQQGMSESKMEFRRREAALEQKIMSLLSSQDDDRFRLSSTNGAKLRVIPEEVRRGPGALLP